jgi:hypothetical protein
MMLRWFLVVHSVWLASVDKLHPSRFPIGRSREVFGLETVVGAQYHLFNLSIIQHSLALLKGQPFSHRCCCILLAAPMRHNIHMTHVQTLHYSTAQEL